MAEKIVRRNWRFEDLTGKRFGRMLVVREVEKQGRGEVAWLCRCDCGVDHVALAASLKSGNTRSCGCLRASEKGRSYSKEYGIWASMIARCQNPKHRAYKNYGGRGIAVYPGWIESFSAWITCIGERPSSRHTLDRYPDNDGNYEPGNVRWATYSEQLRNTRVNRILTFDGRSQPLIAWAEEFGLAKATVRGRLERGWTVEEAFTLPARGRPLNQSARNRHVVFRGKKATVSEHIVTLGITGNRAYIYNRLYEGWPVDDAFLVPRGERRSR